MLQQVLRDLYVDPEILAQLSEDEKQILFCKMREEQIRRWTTWDEKSSTKNNETSTKTQIKNKKSVTFLQGLDGEPWVWVMGEHSNDRSIEDILKEETIEKARNLAEREALELRKQLNDFIDLSTQPNNNSIESIYASVDEINFNEEKRSNNLCYIDNNENNSDKEEFMKNKLNNVLNNHRKSQQQQQNINNSKSCKVAQKVALWEQRLTEQRTCEILRTMHAQRMRAVQEAEENEENTEQLWIEQQKKSKEAEQQMREIARRAREEHRLGNNQTVESAYSAVSVSPLSPVSPGDAPKGKEAVLEWYRSHEMVKNVGVDDETKKYFHGLITRGDSEALLSDKDEGTFLVRLSERVRGYAISYKAAEKCKHYLVDASSGKYSFVGNNQTEHSCLDDLIKFHMECPLSGGEKLKKPCPRVEETPIQKLSITEFTNVVDDEVTETTHI